MMTAVSQPLRLVHPRLSMSFNSKALIGIVGLPFHLRSKAAELHLLFSGEE